MTRSHNARLLLLIDHANNSHTAKGEKFKFASWEIEIVLWFWSLLVWLCAVSKARRPPYSGGIMERGVN